ncbi:hypothetical protein A0H81_04362 [Grifola frondosa]|uniref:Uncharacterized protein n=1 Tax=Grifola frondosa TaxID=5627 RepID=A0A1C7MGU6_GRIFR|nr:hypothetical protein A0H81_04362 [Grifola frondosa]
MNISQLAASGSRSTAHSAVICMGVFGLLTRTLFTDDFVTADRGGADSAPQLIQRQDFQRGSNLPTFYASLIP